MLEPEAGPLYCKAFVPAVGNGCPNGGPALPSESLAKSTEFEPKYEAPPYASDHQMVPPSNSKVMRPALRYDTGIGFVIMKSGTVTGLVLDLNEFVHTKTVSPPAAFGTLLVKSIKMTGFNPFASYAFSLANETRF